jgi:hypothetical protein
VHGAVLRSCKFCILLPCLFMCVCLRTSQMLPPSFTEGFMVRNKVAVWLSQEEDGRGAHITINRRLIKTLKHWGQVSYNNVSGASDRHLRPTRCEK